MDLDAMVPVVLSHELAWQAGKLGLACRFHGSELPHQFDGSLDYVLRRRT